jgi:hypothetical protein
MPRSSMPISSMAVIKFEFLKTIPKFERKTKMAKTSTKSNSSAEIKLF